MSGLIEAFLSPSHHFLGSWHPPRRAVPFYPQARIRCTLISSAPCSNMILPPPVGVCLGSLNIGARSTYVCRLLRRPGNSYNCLCLSSGGSRARWAVLLGQRLRVSVLPGPHPCNLPPSPSCQFPSYIVPAHPLLSITRVSLPPCLPWTLTGASHLDVQNPV